MEEVARYNNMYPAEIFARIQHRMIWGLDNSQIWYLQNFDPLLQHSAGHKFWSGNNLKWQMILNHNPGETEETLNKA